jgi:hypothetical protein
MTHKAAPLLRRFSHSTLTTDDWRVATDNSSLHQLNQRVGEPGRGLWLEIEK